MKQPRRQYNGMSYRALQAHNRASRAELSNSDQIKLRQEGLKNTGWENVIRLHDAIERLQALRYLKDLSLGELFLEADRTGDKYLSSAEQEESQRKLAIAANRVDEVIDHIFPDNQVEVIDYRKFKT